MQCYVKAKKVAHGSGEDRGGWPGCDKADGAEAAIVRLSVAARVWVVVMEEISKPLQIRGKRSAPFQPSPIIDTLSIVDRSLEENYQVKYAVF